MSLVTDRFMAAVEAVADPLVILPVVGGIVFGVAFTLLSGAVADRLNRRAHARRMQEAARRKPVRSEIAWPESPMRRVVREALDDKRRA